MIMRSREIGKRQLRSFGLIVAAGFAVIAFWPFLFRGESTRDWALAVSFSLAAMAWVFPPVLKPFHRVWMFIGEALGWLNTRIILSILFYGVIVPLGAVRRALGHDPMRLKLEPDAKTYRVPRARRASSHMQRQY